MATKVIKFPVAYRQNNNSYSSVYGKYFPVAWRPETLSLRGLIERVAFSQSVYSRDIIEGVIQKLTTVKIAVGTGTWGIAAVIPKYLSLRLTFNES